MPLTRYLVFVGGALLVLLFVADAYLPKVPPSERTDPAMPVIRIHSARKWPERLAFDTSTPLVTVAGNPKKDALEPKAPVVASAGVADVSTRVRVREAFAQLPLSAQLQPAELRKPPPRKLRLARRRAPVLVAQQPQFVWYGNSNW